MPPESESQAPTRRGQDATTDALQHASEAPAPRLAPSERASGRLPEERGAGLSSLWVAGSFVTVASAVAFVACGVWQVGAIISRAQEVADDIVGAHAAAPADPNPRAQPAPAVRMARATPDPVLAAPEVVARTAQVKAEKDAASSTGPVLTATGSPLQARAPASAFEAQAEASERVIPVGLGATLDGSAGLTLGQPPPPGYPRVGCKDIFVYIVTVAEGAPQRSAASIGVGKKGPARFRRPGETIGDWTVLAITDDWTGLNPDVWLEKDGAACRAELAGNPSRIHQAPKPRPKARRRRR